MSEVTINGVELRHAGRAPGAVDDLPKFRLDAVNSVQVENNSGGFIEALEASGAPYHAKTAGTISFLRRV